MTVPPAFVDGVTERAFDLGRGPTVYRFEHPDVPGGYILSVVAPGLSPDRDGCIKALHAQITLISDEDWNIL